MAGEWLTATANTNMFTYEIAPVFILMEHIVLQKMRELIGWNSGDSILAPGGSISNLYAFLAARHKMFPQYKERGLAAVGGQLVMFTSDQVIIKFIFIMHRDNSFTICDVPRRKGTSLEKEDFTGGAVEIGEREFREKGKAAS